MAATIASISVGLSLSTGGFSLGVATAINDLGKFQKAVKALDVGAALQKSVLGGAVEVGSAMVSIQGAVAETKASFANLGTELGSSFQEARGAIGTAANEMAAAMPVVTAAVADLKAKLAELFNGNLTATIKEQFAKLQDAMAPVVAKFSDAWKRVGGAATKAFDAVAAAVGTAFAGVQGALGRALNFGQAALGGVVAFGTRIAQGVGNAFGRALDFTAGLGIGLRAMGGALVKGISALANIAYTKGGPIIKAFGSFFGSIGGVVGSFFSGAAKITAAFLKPFAGMGSAAVTLIATPFKLLVSTVAGLVKPLAEAVGAAFAAVGAVAGAAATFIASKFSEQFERIQKAGKDATTAGMDVGTFSALQSGANMKDIAPDAVSAGLTKLSVELGKAKSGSTEMVAAFGALGISQKELAGLNTEGALRRVADAMAGVNDPSVRAQMAVSVMGKSAAELAPLLEGGSAAIDGFIADGKRIGDSLTALDVAKISQADDALKMMARSSTALWQSVTIAIAPYVTALVEAFSKVGGTSLNMGNIVSGVFDAIVIGVGAAGDIASALWATMKIGAAGVVGGLTAVWEGILYIVRALEFVSFRSGSVLDKMAEDAIKSAEKVRQSAGEMVLSGMDDLAAAQGGAFSAKAAKFGQEIHNAVGHLNAEAAKTAADAASKASLPSNAGAFAAASKAGTKIAELADEAAKVGKTDFEKFLFDLSKVGTLSDDNKAKLKGAFDAVVAAQFGLQIKGISREIEAMQTSTPQTLEITKAMLEARDEGKLTEDEMTRLYNKLREKQDAAGFFAATEQIKELRDQLTIAGLPSELQSAAGALQKFSQVQGVTDTQVKDFQKLQDSIRSAANATKAFDDTRSPLERYQKTMKDLNASLAAGDFTKAAGGNAAMGLNTYARAASKALTELQQAQARPLTAPNALRAGSAEAQRLQFQINSAPKSALDIAKQQLAIAKANDAAQRQFFATVQPAIAALSVGEIN